MIMLFNFNFNFGPRKVLSLCINSLSGGCVLEDADAVAKNVNNASTDTSMPTDCEKKVLSVRNRRQK